MMLLVALFERSFVLWSIVDVFCSILLNNQRPMIVE